MFAKVKPKSRLRALVATVAMLACSAAQAQYFSDDFEDGSATDGSPVTWSDYPAPYNLGTFAVENGDLVISPATSGPVPIPSLPSYHEKDIVVANRLFHDVNVHVRVRALTNQPSVAGIGVLDTHVTNGAMGVSVNSFLVFDGSRRYLGMNGEISQDFSNLGEVNTPINHAVGDVNLRVVIAENQARFSAWPVGQPEPMVPQLQSTLPSEFDDVQGRIVIYAGNGETESPLAFRFVNVVPEPCSSGLLAWGAAAALIYARARSKRRFTTERIRH